jgi:hypothetical protein
VSNPVLIEGYTPEEILAIPDDQLDAFVFTAEPVIFRAGSAEVLGQFEVRGTRVVADLAHIDGGGEGALPAITVLLVRIARRRALREIEWLVHATNCARPNPKLRRVLERRGFEVVEHPQRGACFRKLEVVNEA